MLWLQLRQIQKLMSPNQQQAVKSMFVLSAKMAKHCTNQQDNVMPWCLTRQVKLYCDAAASTTDCWSFRVSFQHMPYCVSYIPYCVSLHVTRHHTNMSYIPYHHTCHSDYHPSAFMLLSLLRAVVAQSIERAKTRYYSFLTFFICLSVGYIAMHIL
mgnify:FL=1